MNGSLICNRWEAERSLESLSIKSEIIRETDYVQILIRNGSEYDFLYSVHLAERPMALNNEYSTQTSYYATEVHLMEGGQEYDVMGWEKESIVNDILNQYDKHVRFLRNIHEAF